MYNIVGAAWILGDSCSLTSAIFPRHGSFLINFLLNTMKTHFLPGQDKTRLRSTAKQHNKIGNYLDQRKVQSSVFFDLNTSKYEWKIN